MLTGSAVTYVSGTKMKKYAPHSGQYQDAEGQESCKVCPKGKYIGGRESNAEKAASLWGRRLQNCADDDACYSALAAQSGWDSTSNCAANALYCNMANYKDDMMECCPQSCGE